MTLWATTLDSCTQDGQEAAGYTRVPQFPAGAGGRKGADQLSAKGLEARVCFTRQMRRWHKQAWQLACTLNCSCSKGQWQPTAHYLPAAHYLP